MRHSIFHRIGREPVLDWGIILAVSAALAIVFVISGFALFTAIEGRISDQLALPIQTGSRNSGGDELARTLKLYDHRAEVWTSTKYGYTGQGDPSF